jgi:hypothetical protein
MTLPMMYMHINPNYYTRANSYSSTITIVILKVCVRLEEFKKACHLEGSAF